MTTHYQLGLRIVVTWTVALALALCTRLIDAQVNRIRAPSPTDLLRVEKWLRLDEDQGIAARQFCDDYYHHLEGDLFDRILRINTLMPSVNDHDFERVFREEESEIRSLRAEIDVRVEVLLENLKSILREDQLPFIDRVRNGWQRTFWAIRSGFSFPEGNVDVIDLVEQLELSDEEQRSVDALIADFEPRFVDALRARHELKILLSALYNEGRAIQENFGPDWSFFLPPDPSSKEETRFWDLRMRSGRMIIKQDRRLESLNRGAFRDFKLALSPMNAAKIERLYLEAAYSMVYPDNATATTLYEAIEQFEDLTVEQRANLDVLRTDFERRHALRSEKMCESIRKRADLQRRGSFDTEQQYLLEWDVLRERGLEREELNARQKTLVGPFLTPEQFALLPEWDFEENHRERPWDFNGESRRVKDQ